MDGIFFYWFGWIGWVVTTFLMRKTVHRLSLSILILLILFLSGKIIHFDIYSINVAFLLAGLVSYAYIGRDKLRIMLSSVLMSIVISFVYIGIHFLIFMDPIWLFFDRLYLISFPLCILVLLMCKPLDLRLSILISGLFNGEIGYVSLVDGLPPGYTIGSFDLLDIGAFSCMVIIVWWGIETLVSIARQQVDKPVSHLKGKAQ